MSEQISETSPETLLANLEAMGEDETKIVNFFKTNTNKPLKVITRTDFLEKPFLVVQAEAQDVALSDGKPILEIGINPYFGELQITFEGFKETTPPEWREKASIMVHKFDGHLMLQYDLPRLGALNSECNKWIFAKLHELASLFPTDKKVI